MPDYLKVIYNRKDRPLTDYPEKLCNYLFHKFDMQPGMKMLEVGCGRGDHLKIYKSLGLNVSAVDRSEDINDDLSGLDFKISDIEKNGLPFPDNHFDIVYSKSFLEHLSSPEIYFKESNRVLKKNGMLLTLVPDWESNYKIYFDDYTHRTPFTIISLNDIYKIFDFNNVNVEKFRQLPIVWKFKFINFICSALAPFVPVRTTNKFLRWSRELMLLGIGYK